MTERRLQRLRGAVPVNVTAVGKAFARVSDRLAGEVLAALGCGFQDGGCLAFARGVEAWSEGEAHAVAFVGPGGVVHHAAAALGEDGPYLDSDGVGTAADVAAKLGAMSPGGAFVAARGPIRDGHGLPEHGPLSEAVALSLREAFGPFDWATFSEVAPDRARAEDLVPRP